MSKVTVRGMCLATGAYQLAWGLAMLLLGAKMLESELGSLFPPEVLLDNPILNGWIRLLGCTLVGLFMLNVCLSRIQALEAQRWIRRGWILHWSAELVIDMFLIQLPAFAAGKAHVTLAAVATALTARSLFVLFWFLSKPSEPKARDTGPSGAAAS